MSWHELTCSCLLSIWGCFIFMSDLLALLTTITIILSVQHASTRPSILQICLTRREKKTTLVKHLLFIVEQTLGALQIFFSKDYVFTFYTSTKSWRSYIFTAVCLCVCVCLCVRLFLWTKFQSNIWTDLEAVFAKRLLSALAWTLFKLVTLGQRSRSQWLKIHFFFIILC